MRKYIKGLFILMLAILSILCFPKSVYAKEDLLITDWIIDAGLVKNGDLQITEDITFEFNDEYNGVFRDLQLYKTSGITDIRVYMKDGVDLQEYARAAKAKNGDQGLYTIEEKDNKLIIKIYSPSKDEVKTFRISYVVKNVAVSYRDTGELYYKFVGKDNDTFIESFIANISLPKEENSDKVIFFAYGPSDAQISSVNNRLYQLRADNIDAGTLIEGRLLFPREYISESENIYDKDRYQEAIAEEAARREALQRNREKREKIKGYLKIISLVFNGIGIMVFAIVLYQCRRRVNKDTLRINYREIPSDCTPAVAAYITGMFVDSNVIFATILDLFRKGYLRIGAVNEQVNAFKNNYIMYKTRDEDMTLSEHEGYFMHWLFDIMGNGEKVSTGRIKSFHSRNSQKYYEAYSTWKKKVKNEAERNGYIDKSKFKHGGLLIAISLAGIILGIIDAIYGNPYAVMDFLVGSVLLIYGLTLYHRLSDKGYLEYKKWLSFKKHMKNHGRNLAKEDVLNTLDPTLIYALSLNVVNDYGLALEAEEAYTAGSWVFWYLVFSGGGDNSFSKSINDSFSGVGGSSSGDSFSGGGGGAGGGGAGGF